MKQLLSNLLILLTLSVTAQQNPWDNYQPLKAEGPVPEDFTEPVVSLMKRNEKLAERIEDRVDSERAAEFYVRSTYEIKELLNSGRILYGDTISRYCNLVLDKVLKDYPKLRKEIRLYVQRSPSHNAFTTNDGIIFVNTGLLAQLETEAQLAFVISHEVVHYAEEHVIDEYMEYERIIDEDEGYENTSGDEKVNSISTFSKDSELEADALGFTRYFKKSGYNVAAPNQLMDIMLYSYLPFNEVKVDKDFLNVASLVIPEEKFKEEVAPISAIEDYDDSESTHPNIKKRRSEMRQTTLAEEGGEDFLISKDAFYHCRKICRFENTRMFINFRDYERAIYNAYLLLKEEPNSKFLKKAIVKSLYAYSAYANELALEDVEVDYEDIEGESQQVNYLLSELTASQLNVIAMAWVLSVKEEYPDDPYLQKAYEHTLDGLVFENEFVYEDFSDVPYDTVVMRIKRREAADTLSTENNSKVANIKRKKRETNGLVGDNFVKYALANFINDSTLRHDFEIRDEALEEGVAIKSFDARSRNKDRSDIFDDNLALGLDKAVFVNPRYLKIEIDIFDSSLDQETTARELYEYKKLVKEVARKLRLKTEIVAHEDIDTKEADEFNHHANLSLWLSERLRHSNYGILVSEMDYISDAKTYYDTEHIIYTGNYNAREPAYVSLFSDAATIFYGMVVYPLAPYYIMRAASSKNKSFNFYYVFNLESGNAELAENTYYDDADKSYFIKSMLYNNLLQTKQNSID
jgi:hypothetical protein